jgi:hypothetical protein
VTSVSVLVVVIAVSGVPASIVDVVDMVTVRDGHMSAALAVNMGMTLMHRVTAGRLAFVVVIVVRSMKMTVMHIVDVITVGDRDMPTPVAVEMVMANMLGVCGSHFASQSLCPGENDLILVAAHARRCYPIQRTAIT